jgi:hypothetical protein
VELLDLVEPAEPVELWEPVDLAALVVLVVFPHCPRAEPVLALGLVPVPRAPRPSSQRQ